MKQNKISKKTAIKFVILLGIVSLFADMTMKELEVSQGSI